MYSTEVISYTCGPSSSVGTATDYGLDGPGIESRWGRDFPPFQTGPVAHPSSCKMGTGSFPGVKCGWGVLLTTHPLLVLRSWKRSYTSTHPLGHNRACNGVTFPLISYTWSLKLTFDLSNKNVTSTFYSFLFKSLHTQWAQITFSSLSVCNICSLIVCWCVACHHMIVIEFCSLQFKYHILPVLVAASW